MSQNGNDPSNVGTVDECLPYCYLTPKGGVAVNPAPPFGYPPAVNASSARCDGRPSGRRRRQLFNGLPENQAKVKNTLKMMEQSHTVGECTKTRGSSHTQSVNALPGNRAEAGRVIVVVMPSPCVSLCLVAED